MQSRSYSDMSNMSKINKKFLTKIAKIAMVIKTSEISKISKISKSLLLSIFAASLTAACVAPPVVVAPKDPVETALDKLLARKSAQKSAGPEIAVQQPQYGDRVTVSFLGDATTLLSDAIKGRGKAWSLTVSGPQPRLPIYVQVNARNVAFNAFLSDVASQLGQRADIVMNGTAVELRYRAQ